MTTRQSPISKQMRGNPWKRIGLTLCGMALVLLLVASWRYAVSRGVFTSVADVTPGVCRTVNGIAHINDIALNGNTAYLASDNGLYNYAAGKIERVAGTPKVFRPTALSLLRGPDGTGLLRAVFSQAGAWEISVFKITPAGAEELGRISTDVLTDPADLVSLDSDRFYLINRHGTHTAFGKWLDDTFLLPRADILWFDGMKFVTVAKRLNSPAGLALSPDGTRLYVTEDYPHALITFTRNDFTGALDNPQALSVSSGLGKITVAANGDLIIAARPKSGSGQVWRVKVQNGVPQSADLIYSKKGEEVTAAAESNGHLLIATGGHLIDCQN